MNAFASTLGFALLAPFAVHAATVGLSGTDGSGYLAVVNVNNESVEPNTPGGKPFDYPYYFDAAQNSWVTIVAEKLSAGSVYAEESAYTVLNKTLTDPDFADFNLGSLGYADGALTGVGTEVLAPGQFTLTLSADDYSPMGSAHNTGGEFSWTYGITASNISGAGLTFINGVLTSIDVVADIKVDVFFGGFPAAAFNPGFFEAGGLTISGNQFAFTVNESVSQSTVLGDLPLASIAFNRTGTIDAVTAVPEPSTWAMMLAGVAGLLVVAGGKQRGRNVMS